MTERACPRSAEDWERMCVNGGRAASQLVALARMRGPSSSARDAQPLATAEMELTDAARACAGAERWSEADRLVRLAVSVAAERASRSGAAPAD
ncbi:MAG: hypothetical protein MI723_00920, partial [Caulobacterales bacterium]|nr:hypothetical protein [Caulobacterales bacterium]